MKISLMAILSFVLFFHGTPDKSKKETPGKHPAGKTSKGKTRNNKCGPFLTIHVAVPAGFGSVSIFKIQVQNTDTGGSTVYPEPTSDIFYPQDGGFHYVVTYTFTASTSGVVSYINTDHNECGNVDFQGTHGAIPVSTLCETYDVSLRTTHVLCN